MKTNLIKVLLTILILTIIFILVVKPFAKADSDIIGCCEDDGHDKEPPSTETTTTIVCECTPGQTQSQSCGSCGSQTKTCGSNCMWGSWGSCTGEGVCSSGSTQSCGNCGTRTCSASCQWGSCTGEGICSPGSSQSCGNCGTRTCSASCAWGSCTNEGVCSPGSTQSCGNCGTKSCTNSCQWGSCSGEGLCFPGSTQSQSCGNCGSQSRTCSNTCSWNSWSVCTDQGVCSPGSTQSCGNCGVQICFNTCQWGSCSGEGPCVPGQIQTQGCSFCSSFKLCSGSQSRVCSNICQWNSWSSCAGNSCSCDVFCGAGCKVNSDCPNYCSNSVRYFNGNCNSACSCSYSTENCNSLDGWYNTTQKQWVDLDVCREKEQLNQTYRDYSCAPSGCIFTITNWKWVDTGNIRNKPDGTVCGSNTTSCLSDYCLGLVHYDWTYNACNKLCSGGVCGSCNTCSLTTQNCNPSGCCDATCNALTGCGLVKNNNNCQNYCSGSTRYFSGTCGIGCSCNYFLENCNSLDGWYDINNFTCNGDCQRHKTQEFRDYSCAPDRCTYIVNNTRDVVENAPAGKHCVGGSFTSVGYCGSSTSYCSNGCSYKIDRYECSVFGSCNQFDYSDTSNCPQNTVCSFGNCVSDLSCNSQNVCKDVCTSAEKLFRCNGAGSCNSFWKYGDELACNPYKCISNACSLTCSKLCGAECEKNSDCKNYCLNNVRYYNGNCGSGCLCSYKTENCNTQDGWYNTTQKRTGPCSDNACQTCEEIKQEYKDCSCTPSKCQCKVTATRWIEKSRKDVVCTGGKVCQEGKCVYVCEGDVDMTFERDPFCPNTKFKVKFSGLSHCSPRKVYLKENDCNGNILGSCTLGSNGCMLYLKMSESGNHTVVACIDKNNDGDFNDPGEQKISNVLINCHACTGRTKCNSLPICGGWCASKCLNQGEICEV